MIGSWLTHDWKLFKTWALTNDVAKDYISENFGCKETLNMINSLFGDVLTRIFNSLREEKKKFRLDCKAAI